MLRFISSPLLFSITQIVERTWCMPGSTMDFTFQSVPFSVNGTIIWLVNWNSGTLPIMLPASTESPTFTQGVKSHSLSGIGSRYTPLSKKKPHFSASSGSGF